MNYFFLLIIEKNMAYETLILEHHETVLLIKLNRPESLNAINNKMLMEICTVLKKSSTDINVRVIIITGSEKFFAAGADIKEMEKKNSTEMYLEDYFTNEHNIISSYRKPLIAGVSGYALGGGCELAMMCDIIYATKTAKFGQPEINLGVMAGIGGTQRLPKSVGKSKAMDMHLTGRYMDAEEAERVGLVSRVLPEKDFQIKLIEIAKKISDKSLTSILAIKEAINISYETNLSSGINFERRKFHSLFSTEDQKEGMAAFVEKRTPKFSDR